MSGRILYMGADYEAYKFCSALTSNQLWEIINRHFVYSLLLADQVIFPVGCYYESEYARRLVCKYRLFFFPYGDNSAAAGLGLGDDRDSYAKDIEKKAEWFPKQYVSSDKEKTADLTKNIEDITPTIRRGSMRDNLASNLLDDISAEGRSFLRITDDVSWKQAKDMVRPLERIARNKEFAMLPPYIQIEMERDGTSDDKRQKRWLDFILFKNYSISCEGAYDAYANNPLVVHYAKHFKDIYPFRIDKRDTLLFATFARLFPCAGWDSIMKLEPEKLYEFGRSESFRHYVYCYNKVIDKMYNVLSKYILDLDYKSIYHEMDNERIDEFSSHLKKLSISDANILYRAISRFGVSRNKRTEQFRKWLTNRDYEYPMIKLLADIENPKGGFIDCYIDELVKEVENRYRDRTRKNRIPETGRNFKKMRFRVALSFPGEYRKVVSEIAEKLGAYWPEEEIMYDRNHKAEFARGNLDQCLARIYQKQSELIVVFLCREYNEKSWCKKEWKAILPILRDEKVSSRVMLVRCGPGDVRGVWGTKDGELDITDMEPCEIAEKIKERYDQLTKS